MKVRFPDYALNIQPSSSSTNFSVLKLKKIEFSVFMNKFTALLKKTFFSEYEIDVLYLFVLVSN